MEGNYCYHYTKNILGLRAWFTYYEPICEFGFARVFSWRFKHSGIRVEMVDNYTKTAEKNRKQEVFVSVPIWYSPKFEKELKKYEKDLVKNDHRFFDFVDKNSKLNEEEAAIVEEAYSKAITALNNISVYLREYESGGCYPSWMHFPFKNKSMDTSGGYSYALNPDNWDLSYKDRVLVSGWMRDCYDYSSIMWDMFPKEREVPIEYLICPHHLFPWFNIGSIAWRMGAGESYSDWWYMHTCDLDNEDMDWLKETYPEPSPYKKYEEMRLGE